MDPGPFGPPPPSYLDLVQHNRSVVYNGKMKHSDLSASIVDIQLIS